MRLRSLAFFTSLALLVGLAAGCFYIEPINQRPSAEIVPGFTHTPHRGEHLQFLAKVYEPDRDTVQHHWSLSVCDADGARCDDPILYGRNPRFELDVPARRGSEPVRKIRVQLDVEDVHGAKALPSQFLLLDIDNDAPMVTLSHDGRLSSRGYPLEVPIELRVDVDDVDDAPADIDIEVTVERAGGLEPGQYQLTRVAPATGDPPSLLRYQLVPRIEGRWTVSAVATDSRGDTGKGQIPVDVAGRGPPCLISYLPLAPAGATLVVDEPRRFAVLATDDDLDVYPPPAPNDPYLGTSTFRWLVASPASAGALVEVAGADTSQLSVDPAHYAPGDIVDVRVEIFDRDRQPVGCEPLQPTCASTARCLQRYTWRLQIR